MKAAERAFIQRLFREEAGGRPVVWASGRTSLGDFDGRDQTVEVFDVPVEDQRSLRDRLWRLRTRLYDAQRIALTVVMHTPEATTKRYSWVRDTLIDDSGPGSPRGRRPDALPTPDFDPPPSRVAGGTR